MPAVVQRNILTNDRWDTFNLVPVVPSHKISNQSDDSSSSIAIVLRLRKFSELSLI